ncbi:release factor glutamine methyltransferase [Sedimentibacter acidaminivorans]|uniref:Release factor glutamine methyltransferase n=1 Tax=Sedimentibacter acidaminivorans TaxID=913099 RepID=A0ABS4G9Y8_9FIRM|nr:peptide chain release factor N(5)-glutamine methyltransferase [Sedimentibacter acidaminivorans]MBP1924497.1 release factor glutamine methyltransferase [Sedimentibacter acidaminivorans]
MVKCTIEKLLKDGLNMIEKRDYNNPFLDVQLILSHLINKDRIYLHMNKDEEVKSDVSKKYYDMVERRNIGYPLQYMINSQEFMGLDFFVQEGVLIPRSDTEILVEKIINLVNNTELRNKTINILDIGTGSGAIALSLGYFLKNSLVTAIDISDIAIETAKINADKLGLSNVLIKKSDVFGDVKNAKSNEKYDIVVSNPPYIEKSVIENLQTEVSKYEPKLALDGGVDGLDYYRRIVEVYGFIHSDKSILSVEIGYNQKKEVLKIFEDAGIFSFIESDKDLSGNDRVVTGYLGM